MRSIRLALIVYLLVLLALALGTFFGFVYTSASEHMQELQERLRKTLARRYDLMLNRLTDQYRATEEMRKKDFDDDLQRKVRALRQQAWLRMRSKVTPMSVAGMAGTISYGFPLQYLWAGEASDPWLIIPIARGANLFEIQVYEPLRLEPYPLDPHNREESHMEGFFQICSESGQPLRSSRALGTERLPLPPETNLAEMKPFDPPLLEDITLLSGEHFRMVTVKSPVPPRLFFFPGRPENRQRNARVPVREFQEPEMPVFVWQYAVPRTELDTAIRGLETELKDTQTTAESESYAAYVGQREHADQTLAQLQTWLIFTILLTFLGTIAGAIWIVRRGLQPIGRISAAVSQVTEKDFELRLPPTKTPKELTSIVEKLKQTLQSLKFAFEREKQAAADISHELRTPIASLLATIQVTLRKPRQPDEYRKTLQTCADIGQQLSGLVERLLALARLDAGTDQLSIEPVDVPELAEQCVEQIRPLAETQGLTLRMDRNGPAWVDTDAGKLREVLLNLLHNAMQYNRPQGEVEVSVRANEGHACLAVRDTGVGIPHQALPHLFERFYRVDPSRQSDTIHAGLGLSIVKGYLDLMGGKILVDSVEGQGSTFRVLLPLSRATPADESERPREVYSS